MPADGYGRTRTCAHNPAPDPQWEARRRAARGGRFDTVCKRHGAQASLNTAHSKEFRCAHVGRAFEGFSLGIHDPNRRFASVCYHVGGTLNQSNEKTALL